METDLRLLVFFREMLQHSILRQLRAMARNGAPDGLPVARGIQLGGDGPVWPDDRAARHAVYVHHQIAERGQVRIAQRLRKRHAIELVHAVRLQLGGVGRGGIGGGHDGSGGELRDGDVVWMPISAEDIEGQHHLRTDAPQARDNLAYNLAWGRLIQVAVNVA